MSVYRCEWCGRFYASSLPEPSACPQHLAEHDARLQAVIARFNAKLLVPVRRDPAEDLPDPDYGL